MSLEFEPFSDRWRQDPYPIYRRLRDEEPIHWAPASEVWCLSRYEDVELVLNQPELFSSHTELNTFGVSNDDMGPIERVISIARSLWRLRITPRTAMNSRMILQEDGDVHHGLRKIVNRGFTPRRIRVWEARINELADEYVERVRHKEHFDFVHEFALPIPVTVIAEILGVEPEHMNRFKGWSDELIRMSSGSGMSEQGNVADMNVIPEMREYLMPIVRARRAAPRDDLISTIIEAEAGDQPLTNHELFMFLVFLLAAGNETTTNLLGNAVDALLDNPEVMQRVVSEPTLIPGLVEETLRWDCPVQYISRETTRDVEIRGIKIPGNQPVLVMLGAANRDERQFDDPDRFDPSRQIRNHLGFGLGHHFCLGASLARLEATAALTKILPLLPGFERANSEREFLDSHMFRGRSVLELRAAN